MMGRIANMAVRTLGNPILSSQPNHFAPNKMPPPFLSQMFPFFALSQVAGLEREDTHLRNMDHFTPNSTHISGL